MTSLHFRSSPVALFLSSLLICPTLAIADGQLRLRLTLLEQSPVATPASARSDQPGKETVTIAQGVPLSVRVELTNTGSQPVRILPSLNPRDGMVYLSLTGPDGKASRLTAQRWETVCTHFDLRQLPPGQSLVHENFLFGRMNETGSHDYVFPQTGQYQIVADYASVDPGTAVTSNIAYVLVADPISDWKALQDAGIVDAIEGRSRSNAEHLQRLDRLKELLDPRADNPYAPWIAAMSASGANASAAPARPNEIDPALKTRLQSFLDRFAVAMVSADVATLTKLMTPDVKMNSVLTRDEILAKISAGFKPPQQPAVDRKSGAAPAKSEPISRSPDADPGSAPYKAAARIIAVADDAQSTSPASSEFFAVVRIDITGGPASIETFQIIRFSLMPTADSWQIQKWDRIEP